MVGNDERFLLLWLMPFEGLLTIVTKVTIEAKITTFFQG